MKKYPEYDNCTLCPRKCKVNRNAGLAGVCLAPSDLIVSKAYLHMWEEPFISGKEGSGTVFFSGCSLKCVFCQNYEISGVTSGNLPGRHISTERLSEIFISLQNKGANNINLVTGAHYIPHIVDAIAQSRNNGLTIPILYNSGGYENVSSLKMLDGRIDIYLPDFKYMKPSSSALLSKADDYPSTAMKAIEEMYRQVGPCVINPETNMLTKGLVVRHLVLPGAANEACEILKYLYETYNDNIYISIMNQYTPFPSHLPCGSDYDRLRRKVTKREYNKVIDYALSIGISNAFIQDGSAVSESFIPSFDSEGV